MSEKIQIHLVDIINHLANGVTRKISSTAYNAEAKSIEEIYGLTPTQVDRLFKNPNLKGLRVKPIVDEPFELIIGDITESVDETQESEVETELQDIINSSEDEVEEKVDFQDPVATVTANSEGLDVFS